jgi:hypothetical protein
VGVAGWRGQSRWWLGRRTPLTRHAALPLACIEKHLKITSWLVRQRERYQEQRLPVLVNSV